MTLYRLNTTWMQNLIGDRGQAVLSFADSAQAELALQYTGLEVRPGYALSCALPSDQDDLADGVQLARTEFSCSRFFNPHAGAPKA